VSRWETSSPTSRLVRGVIRRRSRMRRWNEKLLSIPATARPVSVSPIYAHGGKPKLSRSASTRPFFSSPSPSTPTNIRCGFRWLRWARWWRRWPPSSRRGTARTFSASSVAPCPHNQDTTPPRGRWRWMLRSTPCSPSVLISTRPTPGRTGCRTVGRCGSNRLPNNPPRSMSSPKKNTSSPSLSKNKRSPAPHRQPRPPADTGLPIPCSPFSTACNYAESITPRPARRKHHTHRLGINASSA